MPADARRVDLHIHTTASDGLYAPAEIVRRAAEAGLAAIAITDHDTVAGLGEALDAGRRLGLEVLTGTELSAEFPNGTMHILGYGFDPRHPALLSALEQYRRFRDERNPQILAKLAELGMPIRYEAVRAKAGGESVGRPHIAQALVEAGHVTGVDEAFRLYLARGRPAYVNRRRASPEEAIRMIRAAGGAAVLAHAGQLKRTMQEVRRIVAGLATAGLDGIEVWHPDHSADDMRALAVLARQLGLAATGGTDYHGHVREDVRLGVGRGNLAVGYEAVEALRARLAARSG